jgi:hypothetical protein
MPYRSQVQQLLPELTLDGDDELVLRDVKDGTSESSSESRYESSLDVDDAGETVCREKREVSASIVAWLYCVFMTWRVWWGRSGFGETILEGEMERPLGIEAVLIRRLWREEAC